jgi:sialate O-acetylesterase
LIHTSWGGTPAEAWTSRETLEANPKLKVLVDRWDTKIRSYLASCRQYLVQYETWLHRSSWMDNHGERVQVAPQPPEADPRRHPHRTSGLHNAMIRPLIPYAIQGSIWYQGESNASRAYQYRTLFPAMIQDWRTHWGQGDFPFLFVQLANFQPTKPEPGPSMWAELREAQLMALQLPKTGMALAIDIGEANDIHPRNKQDVGKRLALNALAIAYGKEVSHTGPLYESVEFKGGKATVKFKGAVMGLTTRNNEPLKGFAIAGEDHNFVWADAKIDGDSVVVSSDRVKSPVAVRYGWADNPVCNLYDGTGLPASPFRTDDWPGDTIDNE